MIFVFKKLFGDIAILKNKNVKRGIWIGLNAFNGLSAPLFNLVLSAIITKKISLSFWGEFTSLSLIVNLSAMILGWGNKEFLLREFSRNPSNIASHWQVNLAQRSLLCILLAASFYSFLDYSYFRISVLIFWIVSSFLYKSLDILVLFKRTFSFSLFAETVGYIMVLGASIFSNPEIRTVDFLILLLAYTTFFKFILSVWYFRNEIFPLKKFNKISLKTNTLFLSIPYFLPSLVGLLQGKMDLYCVVYFLPSDKVGKYQILMNLLTVPHILATFIIMPFIKNIYRLPVKSVKKIIRGLTILGLVSSLPAIIIVYFITQKYYMLQFSIWIYFLGYLQLIPFFVYLVKTNMLFKHDKQYIVVCISTSTAVISFLISIFLIPYWNLEGAIIANTITQWTTLFLFIIFSNRYAKKNG